MILHALLQGMNIAQWLLVIEDVSLKYVTVLL